MVRVTSRGFRPTIEALEGRQFLSNTAPHAVNDVYSTPRNTPLTVFVPADVLANDFDTDGDGFEAQQVDAAAHGWVVLDPDGSFSYLPNNNFVGTDTFTYVATDGQDESNVATVFIQVGSPPPPPTLSVNDVSVTEGNSGTRTLTFTVKLSSATPNTVNVNFATANDTAVQPSDYIQKAGTLTFTPGQTSKTVAVTVNGDTKVEADESFFLNLSAAQNATIADSQGRGTIKNDDVPHISIVALSASKAEGTGSGFTSFTFTVKLDQAGLNPVTVKYATADGTAKSATDYTATSNTLTFSAGQTQKTITVLVRKDALKESNETFLVKLSNAVNATISGPMAQGLIINDD